MNGLPRKKKKKLKKRVFKIFYSYMRANCDGEVVHFAGFNWVATKRDGKLFIKSLD